MGIKKEEKHQTNERQLRRNGKQHRITENKKTNNQFNQFNQVNQFNENLTTQILIELIELIGLIELIVLPTHVFPFQSI